MEGVGGKPAWAWIFILEGLVTVVAGIVSFWIIQDFPDTAKFLSEAERTVVVRRLQSDDQYSAAGENLRWHYIWRSLLDWKTWVGSEWCLPRSVLLGRELMADGSGTIHGCGWPAVCFLAFPAEYHQSTW